MYTCRDTHTLGHKHIQIDYDRVDFAEFKITQNFPPIFVLIISKFSVTIISTTTFSIQKKEKICQRIVWGTTEMCIDEWIGINVTEKEMFRKNILLYRFAYKSKIKYIESKGQIIKKCATDYNI